MENYRAARKTVSTADILGPLYLVMGFSGLLAGAMAFMGFRHDDARRQGRF